MTRTMEYIGIDPAVGLECSSCKHISRLPYSELLNRVLEESEIYCDGCSRAMMHDWTTVNVVQNIIRKRLKQANEDKVKKTGTA
ncbi:MAG: hypothetical protein GKR90_00685 [Pseudomonadales bacterium]|nr:hypothetical protein [Pseudomonadales bacterium]